MPNKHKFYNQLAQHLVFATLLIVFIFRLWPKEPILYGDGIEYILQTQSIALHGQLAINTEQLRDYWNRTNPYHLTLTPTRPPTFDLNQNNQAGGGFGGLYADRFDNYRYYHFWSYPLFTSIVYFLLHHTFGHPTEYLSFFIINIIFLLLPFILIWIRKNSWLLLTIIFVSFFSPLWSYTNWQHPELFCFSLCLSGLILASRANYLAPIIFSIGTTQNIPLILFYPLLIVIYYFNNHQKFNIKFICSLIFSTLITSIPFLYFRYYFGVYNVINALGLAEWRYASLGRVIAMYISPMIGAIWFYPACFFLLPFAFNKADHQKSFIIISSISLVLLASWVATSTSNFNSGQIGALRYTAWLLVPLWFLLLSSDYRLTKRGLLAFLGLPALCLFVTNYFKLDRLTKGDIVRFQECQRVQPETAKFYSFWRFEDDMEVLAENISGQELSIHRPFFGIYAWNLDDNISLMIISGNLFDYVKPEYQYLITDTAKRINPVFGEYAFDWVKQPLSVHKILSAAAPYFIRGSGNIR